ncbi:MAG: hypothetical protein J6386_23270 [Candidatus Synoicihabitans palmerolidicus]|nr:hypothetical protein [Candidatus Synoicihabitans palmerolidicus]
MHDFVIEFGRKCIERVQTAGKKAFVFYDDHWIGVEPNSPRFPEFGYDGLIKCVFNAFEVRLCGHAKGQVTRELRLHPYLFPTGLKGEPTFAPGGDPTLAAKNFWIDARRGILRTPIDRIGFGGYLSLVEPYPDFQDYIAGVAREFRQLKALRANGRPWTAPFKVAVLTAWGDLRAWTCSGLFMPGVELYDVQESLAGLPIDVEFISFDDLVARGVPKGVRTSINCGRAGTAWSGGEAWSDPRITDWVHRGGGLVGIGEPSAWPQPGRCFRLAEVLGVDCDTGDRLANGKFRFAAPAEPAAAHFFTADVTTAPALGAGVKGLFVKDESVDVLVAMGRRRP